MCAKIAFLEETRHEGARRRVETDHIIFEGRVGQFFFSPNFFLRLSAVHEFSFTVLHGISLPASLRCAPFFLPLYKNFFGGWWGGGGICSSEVK